MWLVESTKGPIITLDWPFSYVLTNSALRIKVLVPPIRSFPMEGFMVFHAH